MALDAALIPSGPMCGIGGILRIVKPGEPDYPRDPRSLDLSPNVRSPDSGWLIPEEWLDAIDEGIKWRGPDGQGRFRDRVIRPDGSIVEVALVHRRLAIIDLEGGAQPMICDGCPACDDAANRDRQGAGAGTLESRDRDGASIPPTSRERGRADPYLLHDPSSPEPPRLRYGGPQLAAIVFNGCIYNHRDLRAELEAKGHVFRTDHSDTEVILHAAREWGGHSGPRFDAMFSFLLWDRSRGALIAARDGFGEKPLYATWVPFPDTTCFSSTAPPLRTVAAAAAMPPDEQPPLPPPDASIDAAQVVDWASLGFGVGATPWSAIAEFPINDAGVYSAEADRPRVALGAAAVSVGAGLALAAADSMSYGGASKLLRSLDPRVPTRIRSIDHLDDLLAASVRGRLDADVSLGCFLSGGIDSSLIAHYALRERGALTTLTVRMPDARYDESPHAERVAAHLGTNHIVLDCDAESAAEDLVLIIETLGLPFGDSSILPTYWLCRAAREMVKVALAGDGGDELFYGYDRYGASRYIWLGGLVYPSWLRRTDPRSKSERLARLAIAARSSNRYWELLAIFQRPDRRALFGKAKGCLCADPFLPQHTEPRMVDLGTYLPCDLLRKVDTASLMNGLEVRCPMLAKALAEAAYVTSRRSLTRGGPKGMLRELARKHLPREVADRPKQGFSIPISNWWRTNFGGLRDLLLDVLAGERPFGRVHDVLEINMDFVRRMLDEHWAAGGLTPMHTSRHVRPRDHGQRLFALVSLAIWSRTIR